MFYVYIIVSEVDGSLYTGQTNDLKKRIHKHNQGYVIATKSKKPFRLGYFEQFSTRKEAMWREWELKKKWNTVRKKKLVSEFNQERLKEFSE
ncbi:MAG: GIY-YIG nuclease family protein [Bacteroidota bacterium]